MRICELMEQRGIQRIQLADAMGVSPSCITKWVQGTALPSADKLPRLAAILQCSIDAPFGLAVCSEETGTWTYNISPGLLVKYKRGDLPTYRLRELEEVMVRHVQEALDLRLAGVSALMGKVLSA